MRYTTVQIVDAALTFFALILLRLRNKSEASFWFLNPGKVSIHLNIDVLQRFLEIKLPPNFKRTVSQ